MFEISLFYQATFINNTFEEITGEELLYISQYTTEWDYTKNSSVSLVNTELQNSSVYSFYKIEVKNFLDINSVYKDSNFSAPYVFR